MNARGMLAVLWLGLIPASHAALAGAPAHPSSAATPPVAHQLDRAQRQLHEQTSQTQQLHQQVHALEKQRRAARRHLRERDRAIERLREQLDALQSSASGG